MPRALIIVITIPARLRNEEFITGTAEAEFQYSILPWVVWGGIQYFVFKSIRSWHMPANTFLNPHALIHFNIPI